MTRKNRDIELGSISFLTAILFLIMVAIAYFGYMLMPIWLKNRELITVMNEVAYQAWKVHDDRELSKQAIARFDKVFEDEEVYEPTVEVKRDEKFVYIDLDYAVEVKYPFVDKIRDVSFSNHVECDLKTPRE